MSKCIRCGKSTVLRGHVSLKDSAICTPCFLSLGFKLSDIGLAKMLYSYDDIKDGKEAMDERNRAERNRKYAQKCADKFGLTVPHYHQLSSIGATDMEKKIFSRIHAVLLDDGKDADIIEITAGERGSVALSVGGTVFITYKADEGVKWIVFENESPEKIRIAGAGRMNSLAPRIIAAYDYAN